MVPIDSFAALCERYPRQREVAVLLVSSVILLVIGLSLPLITVEKRFLFRHWEDHYSVYTGVVGLWEHQDYVLAVVIFFFSMVFPFAKLFLLTALWFKKYQDARRRMALYWLGILGRWSMLDVFAVAILIVAAKLQPAMQVQPRSGVYIFGLAIALSMYTSMRIENLAMKCARGSDPPLI